jgi:hypothetical protein
MGHQKRLLTQTTQAVRRPLAFEPLEPRFLFATSPVLTTINLPSPPIIFPGPILPIGPIGPLLPVSGVGLSASSPLLSILDNRQLFNGVVATFTDDYAASPSAYSATINWGDGSSIDQATVVSDPAGGFDVLGSHSYVFGQYNPTITITAPGANPGDDPRGLVISQSLAVFPPPTACEAFPVSAVDGHAFRGTIATYTGLDTTQLNRYSANIDWGDGNQSAGELLLNPDGSVSVVGQHVYSAPGFDDIQITLTANGAAADTVAATARCRATVANGPYAGTVQTGSIESGVPYSGNVAFFQFLGPNQDISTLRADVIISGSTDGPLTIPGTIVPGDDGFYVAANALFTSEYGQSIVVRIYDTTLAADPAFGPDAQLFGQCQGSIAIASHLHLTVLAPDMTAGQESRVLLGHLDSDDPDDLWNKSFDVQVNWGDGSNSSEGEAVPDPAGGYDIYGTHTYALLGYATSYSFNVNITETRTSADPAASSQLLTYSISGGTDYWTGVPSISVSAGTFTGFILNASSNTFSYDSAQVFATLYLGTDLSSTTSDIIATVQWPDGETTTAQVTPDGGNQVSVFASRSDLPAGQYSAVLSVSIGQYQQSASVYANVETYVAPIDYSLYAQIQAVPVNAFVGDHFHGVIATFSVPGSSAQASDYSCNVWIPGAGNTITSIVSNGDGTFSIVADFDAVSPNDSNPPWECPSVQIYQGSKFTSANLSISITTDSTRVNLTPANNLNFRQREMFTTTVATFTAPPSDDNPADYTAIIDWGDGVTTQGVITEQYDGTFDISGTYGYVHNSGSITLKITVTDSTGRAISCYSSMYLDPDPVEITPGTPTISTGTVSGNLANFVDDDGESTDPSEYRVYHAALIDWGDGTITSGLVTTNPDGTYSVASTHDYQADGDYQIHVMVRRNTFYAWQPTYVLDPIVYNGSNDLMIAAISNDGSSITADPDSDFGVTFYVHVVGTADRVAENPVNDSPQPSSNPPSPVTDPTQPDPITVVILTPNDPADGPTQTPSNTPGLIVLPTQPSSIISKSITVFSSSAISLANARPDQLTNNSEPTDTWLASDLPLLDPGQEDLSDSSINSELLGTSN